MSSLTGVSDGCDLAPTHLSDIQLPVFALMNALLRGATMPPQNQDVDAFVKRIEQRVDFWI